jgi:hypothetical protein
MCQKRRSNKFLKDVNDPVQELQRQQRFDFSGGGQEEEEIGVDETEDKCGWRRIRKVY